MMKLSKNALVSIVLMVFFSIESSIADDSQPLYYDLTLPENVGIADNYTPYELMVLWSVGDTQAKSSGDDALALTGFCLKLDCKDWDSSYYVEIARSTEGSLMLYLHVLDFKCDSNTKEFEKVVFGVQTDRSENVQNVKFTEYCSKDHRYYTPTSVAGKNFLIDAFKKSVLVKIIIKGIPVPFDAEGFTKAWNSFGGDAL